MQAIIEFTKGVLPMGLPIFVTFQIKDEAIGSILSMKGAMVAQVRDNGVRLQAGIKEIHLCSKKYALTKMGSDVNSFKSFADIVEKFDIIIYKP